MILPLNPGESVEVYVYTSGHEVDAIIDLSIHPLPPHESPVYRARETGVTPHRSPPGGPWIIWILGFANNRLTITDFRDVRLLAV